MVGSASDGEKGGDPCKNLSGKELKKCKKVHYKLTSNVTQEFKILNNLISLFQKQPKQPKQKDRDYNFNIGL